MTDDDLTSECDRFKSWADFEYFRAQVVASSDFQAVSPDGPTPYADLNFSETWYRHLPTGKIYRLVEPDGPFRGIWTLVSQDRPN